MSDTPRYETREVSSNDIERRSGEFGAIVDAVQAVGGPAAIVSGVGYGAKLVKDVIVAKIDADARVEVARIEHGYPAEGGAHRD